jgi:serine/threonine protein kinase/Tol biopolymer transport system component/Flp pilus assembly protein TadD
VEPKLEDIEKIYHTALEAKSQAQRSAYLDVVCGDNADLRAQVEALLKANEEAGDFLEAPVFDADITYDTSPITEVPGAVIGKYKLLEQIGEGGMAVVYMAEQERPVRRKVALKIIKLGMDTKQVIARFEAERQALAIMDHPNIAKVFDAGTTETGRPYFVMELVKGVSITEYCDKNKLGTRERLDLFVQVCNATKHAHQKGIIHRDIKPTNVMVTLHDGNPVPKVIDFGIAKATNQRLTEKTFFTRYAQMIGTPAYMSPEQAEMSGLDVDTRTDIYSLGVLLYELLTGTTPFDGERLRSAGYLELQRIIREEEPTKPSTKLSTLGDVLTVVAENRKTSPDLLRKVLKGDLDWIVMKLLEKDRTRRYESTHELALDIQRHLNNEPVTAGSPSVGYRLHKFLRRHKSRVVGVFLVVVVIAALMVVGGMYLRALRATSRTESLRHAGALSKAQEAFSRQDFDSAREQLASILESTHVGREARLLNAKIVMNIESAAAAMLPLNDLLDGTDRVSGEAHFLMAQIYFQSDPNNAKEISQYHEQWDYHRRRAEELLSGTATYDFLQGMAANAVLRKLRFLSQALEKDGQHYDALRERVYLYYAAEDYVKMLSDASRMIGIRPENPLGYSLRAMALREIDSFEEALEDHRQAIRLSPGEAEPYDQRRQTFMNMGDYEQALADAMKCVSIEHDNLRYQFDVFCAQVALGWYDSAEATHRAIIQHPQANHQLNLNALGAGEPGYHIHMRLQRYAAKYVFDTLAAGRTWHPPQAAPEVPAFRALNEATDYYQYLSERARRLVKTGFGGSWSPDGSKLAYSMGVLGFSGVAILDLETGKRKLLAVPGRGPVWSPDGQTIAYVRYRKIMTSAILADQTRQPEAFDIEEICLIRADGTEEPRPLVEGDHPQWSESPQYLYYRTLFGVMTNRISVEDKNAQPEPVVMTPPFFPAISPDGRYVAEVSGELRITDITTKQVVQKWRGPLWSHYVTWSSDGQQLIVSGRSGRPDGLWIYDRNKNEGRQLMKGPAGSSSCWSPNGNRFELSVGFPYVEIWVIDIPEGSSLQEMLGPGVTVQEHGQALVDYYDRAIEAEPEFTEHYLCRAEQALWLYGEQGASAYLHDFELALSRCDFRPFGILWHIWSRHCWPPFGQCRTMSPLAILLAEKVFEEKGWKGILGLAHYRAGHWEETIELVRPRAERSQGNGINCFLMAMSCWQLGQKEEASTWYAKGMDRIDSHKQPPTGAFWLQAEATMLLGMPETEIMELRKNK